MDDAQDDYTEIQLDSRDDGRRLSMRVYASEKIEYVVREGSKEAIFTDIEYTAALVAYNGDPEPWAASDRQGIYVQ